MVFGKISWCRIDINFIKKIIYKMPKISCIMTTYNSEKYLRTAIESILNQTFKDFEFIISEWWSTDDTKKIIKEYMKKDNRIILIDNTVNLTNCECLNQCLEMAKWEYIAIMESDDYSTEDRFEFCSSLCLQNNIDVLYPKYIEFSQDCEIENTIVEANSSELYRKQVLERHWLSWSIWWTVCSFFKKEICKKIWNFEHRYSWDTHFSWKVFLNNLRYYNVDKVVYYKRKNLNSLWYSKRFIVWKDLHDGYMSHLKNYKVSSRTKIIIVITLYYFLVMNVIDVVNLYMRKIKV